MRIGPSSQPLCDRALFNLWAWALTSLHKKQPEPGKRVCSTFPFGRVPDSLIVRRYGKRSEDYIPTEYILNSALLELHAPGGLEYSLTPTTEESCQFLHLGKNSRSKIYQLCLTSSHTITFFHKPTNATSTPHDDNTWGSENWVCVHQLENWTTITALGWLSTLRPMGKGSYFTSQKSNPNLGKRACGTFPFGQVPDSLIRRYAPGGENHEFHPRLGNLFLCIWKKKWRLTTEYLLTFLPDCGILEFCW